MRWAAAQRRPPWPPTPRMQSCACRSQMPFRASPRHTRCAVAAGRLRFAAPDALRTDRTHYVTVRTGAPQVLYPSAGENSRYLWHDTHMNQADFRRNGEAGVTPLGHDVFEIDTRMAGYSQITAGYLIRADRPCLVETGTAPSAPVVRDALAALGVGPGDLATVVVTHIHLDHAGGVGDIAGMFPGAEIVVHELGARHLADPSRLMKSPRRVYRDGLDWLLRELAPTPAERIRPVEEQGPIALGRGRAPRTVSLPRPHPYHHPLLPP